MSRFRTKVSSMLNTEQELNIQERDIKQKELAFYRMIILQ